MTTESINDGKGDRYFVILGVDRPTEAGATERTAAIECGPYFNWAAARDVARSVRGKKLRIVWSALKVSEAFLDDYELLAHDMDEAEVSTSDLPVVGASIETYDGEQTTDSIDLY